MSETIDSSSIELEMGERMIEGEFDLDLGIDMLGVGFPLPIRVLYEYVPEWPPRLGRQIPAIHGGEVRGIGMIACVPDVEVDEGEEEIWIDVGHVLLGQNLVTRDAKERLIKSVAQDAKRKDMGAREQFASERRLIMMDPRRDDILTEADPATLILAEDGTVEAEIRHIKAGMLQRIIRGEVYFDMGIDLLGSRFSLPIRATYEYEPGALLELRTAQGTRTIRSRCVVGIKTMSVCTDGERDAEGHNEGDPIDKGDMFWTYDLLPSHAMDRLISTAIEDAKRKDNDQDS